MHLLLAHELPSNLGDNEARHACPFDNFWKDGWTPSHLLRGDANVYKQIAIPLKVRVLRCTAANHPRAISLAEPMCTPTERVCDLLCCL